MPHSRELGCLRSSFVYDLHLRLDFSALRNNVLGINQSRGFNGRLLCSLALVHLCSSRRRLVWHNWRLKDSEPTNVRIGQTVGFREYRSESFNQFVAEMRIGDSKLLGPCLELYVARAVRDRQILEEGDFRKTLRRASDLLRRIHRPERESLGLGSLSLSTGLVVI